MVTTSIKGPTEVQIFPPIWWPETPRWAELRRCVGNGAIRQVLRQQHYRHVLWGRAGDPDRLPLGLRLRPHPVPLPGTAVLRHARGDDDPGQVALIPNYVTLKHLGWMATSTRDCHPLVSSVFGAFLLRQAILSMPADLFDAAHMDGLGHFRCMLNIALPLAPAGRGDAGAVPLHRQVERLPVDVDRHQHAEHAHPARRAGHGEVGRIQHRPRAPHGRLVVRCSARSWSCTSRHRSSSSRASRRARSRVRRCTRKRRWSGERIGSRSGMAENPPSAHHSPREVGSWKHGDSGFCSCHRWCSSSWRPWRRPLRR